MIPRLSDMGNTFSAHAEGGRNAGRERRGKRVLPLGASVHVDGPVGK